MKVGNIGRVNSDKPNLYRNKDRKQTKFRLFFVTITINRQLRAVAKLRIAFAAIPLLLSPSAIKISTHVPARQIRNGIALCVAD